MAITVTSTTPIELLLKNALQKENLNFKEQYRIYEKGNSYHPKYVADFLVTFQGRSVIVECDGFSYHSSDFDVVQDIQRDNWLKQHGYGKVLHFTTFQLTYETNTVLLIIKQNLGIVNVPKSKLKFKGKKVRKSYITNIPNSDKLHNVTLYYSYTQVKDQVWIVYKFQDNTLNRFSEERIKSFYNVPDKIGNELSIYTALKDLRKSVNLLIYSSSDWLTAYLNQLVQAKSDPHNLLSQIDEILKTHNYLVKHINANRDTSYYEHPSQAQFIVHELHSRCLQMRHKFCGNQNDVNAIDFTLLL
ncbi:MAG: endonuclease domain-containing protein [Faecousia sp.]